ncbi:MAG: LytTR family transcriptional regulator DNA-binding domain-containing protein [Eggerthellaceae bacterium]|nr:LytTR family transcriptional regulator DNA-binding domain-containing protein [Eggerthellaceae bacterium]
MKKRVNVRFEVEEGCRGIDVLFTASERDGQVDALIERVADPLAGTWAVQNADGFSVTLSEERIVTACSENKRLKIVADDGEYRLNMSMQDFERAVNPSMFLRVSRYEIVNLRRVERFDFSVSGTLRIELEDGTEVWASRRFIPAVKERLSKKG